MTPEQRKRVEDLFDRVSVAPVDQRAVMLVELCPDDGDVRAEVASLLETPNSIGQSVVGADDSTGFVKQAFAALGGVAPQVPGVGKSIGPYKIIEPIGEGGMGAVYKAEQHRPHRFVALKVIRPGYMTPALLRRFEYEADVLARLEHPGIARIYEAGIETTESGKLPFFAMELVDGQRLDRYLASTSLALRERLSLLIELCQAVHHAHSKGIIHRDLKPANILITADGHPKVLDFGVARMTDSDIRSTTLHTMSGQLVGTLPYMAPEQAAGNANALDTSSDVYALGVIAFELLSGRMPYSLEGKALHEAVGVICQEEPTRLSSIDRSLRGDVETIVRKALEKDRRRRYATAGELAADVKRYLDYEPITARRPSTWYQLRKFARRNRALSTGVLVTLVALMILVGMLGIGLARERKLHAQLLAEKQQTNAVNTFLEDVIGGANPDRMHDAAVTERVINTMIEPAATKIDQRFKDAPDVEATVRFALAKLFIDVGRGDLAIPHVERSLQLRQKHLGNDDPETLITLSAAAKLLGSQGKFAESEARARQAVAAHRRVLGEDHPNTQNALAVLAQAVGAQGKLAEAAQLYKSVFEWRNRKLGQDDPDTLMALHNYAAVVFYQGDEAEAEALYKQLWERSRGIQGADNSSTLDAQANYAYILGSRGKADVAEPIGEMRLSDHVA